jgi:hypothetical protein
MTTTVLSRCSVIVVVPGWVCPDLQIAHCIVHLLRNEFMRFVHSTSSWLSTNGACITYAAIASTSRSILSFNSASAIFKS